MDMYRFRNVRMENPTTEAKFPWCSCVRTQYFTYTHTCIHTRIHAYIHTYMHTYIHTHTYIHIHTHTHTYAHTYIVVVVYWPHRSKTIQYPYKVIATLVHFTIMYNPPSRAKQVPSTTLGALEVWQYFMDILKVIRRARLYDEVWVGR